MALNKKSLGPAILSYEKGTNEEVKMLTLAEFAIVVNALDGTTMICFSTNEVENKYFWASTSLATFLSDNVENAVHDEDRDTYSFPEDTVTINYKGKTKLKSDATRECNVWQIIC